MLEHLDRSEAKAFLAEVMRVLQPGGILRLALPDLRRHVEDYLASNDGDQFIFNMHVWRDRPRGLTARLKHIFVGERHHLWMYDAKSLAKLLAASGFVGVLERKPGETGIPEPGDLNLRERDSESVYMEARKP